MTDSVESPTRIPIRSASPEETRNRSKRQSLLLQPGTLVAATQRQALGNAALPRVTGLSPVNRRPITMFSPNVPSLADLAAQFGDEDMQVESQDDDTLDTATSGARRTVNSTVRPTAMGWENKIPSAPPTTSKAALTRSQSLRKPTSSSATVVGESSARGVQTRSSHALNPSTLSRPLFTLAENTNSTKFNLSRPTSSASSSDSHPVTTRMKTPTANPSASQTSLRRTASTRANARAQSGLPSPLSQPGTGGAGGAGGGMARLDASANTTLSERPAFTTLQQHYSPLKRNGLKPLSSTLIHSTASLASSFDAGSSLGFETQVLQAQVLQLSLLQRDGERTMKEWEHSAMEKLRAKFDSVAKKAERVSALERETVKARNISALRAWGAPSFSSFSEEGEGVEAGIFAENVQTLARVVQDVSLLAEEGGKVDNVLSEFERWVSHVEAIWDARGSNKAGTAGDWDVIEGLGEAWRTEVANLTRRLGSLGRALESLPNPEEGSGIEAVVKGFGELVRGLEEELKVVRDVERGVGERERSWVDERLAVLGPRIGIAVG